MSLEEQAKEMISNQSNQTAIFKPNKVVITVGDKVSEVEFTPNDYLYCVRFKKPYWETTKRIVDTILEMLPDDALKFSRCIDTSVDVCMDQEYRAINSTEQTTYPGMGYDYCKITDDVSIKPVFNWVGDMGTDTVIELPFSWGKFKYNASSVGGMVYAYRKKVSKYDDDSTGWSAYNVTDNLMTIEEFRKFVQKKEETIQQTKVNKENLKLKVKDALSKEGIVLDFVESSYDETGGTAYFLDTKTGVTVGLYTTNEENVKKDDDSDDEDEDEED